MTDAHTPVMLEQVLEALAVKTGGLYVDSTFGRGGYTRGILERGAGCVHAIDRDPEALEAGAAMVEKYGQRLVLHHGNFSAMDQLIGKAGAVDGIALDLGVSSPQLDEAARGFSFQKDGPLDMRMDQSSEHPTAADLLNTTSEAKLADIFYHYGQERYARRVAHRIVERRQKAPFESTQDFAQLVRSCVPSSKDGLDPATRCFQALRIAVNDELSALEDGLLASLSLLKPQGRLAVVSFHSLEDRRVKNFMRHYAKGAQNTSRHTPGAMADKPQPALLAILSRKAEVPSAQEIRLNPRARSARLRVAMRLDTLQETDL
ncbi:MAG: 16S rRNA (cytosine(1402)-N(4))-methyltransferase RsmH [Alphaproteobacteria bacterium]|nr:16S rRNA (cytosine(1402)-N(4))-methyltransferase RsmH [Alphaproteobacteria bacterium]